MLLRGRVATGCVSSSQAVRCAPSQRIEPRTNSLRSGSVRACAILFALFASDRICVCGMPPAATRPPQKTKTAPYSVQKNIAAEDGLLRRSISYNQLVTMFFLQFYRGNGFTVPPRLVFLSRRLFFIVRIVIDDTSFDGDFKFLSVFEISVICFVRQFCG